jgi:hypothetical protein
MHGGGDKDDHERMCEAIGECVCLKQFLKMVVGDGGHVIMKQEDLLEVAHLEVIVQECESGRELFVRKRTQHDYPTVEG